MQESETKMSSQASQPGTVYKYDKTGSRADMSGELYEVKMSLLLFLRGINSTGGFYLASNVDGAGAFDDILFKFRPLDAPDTFKTCFLQLKHKQRKPVLQETEKKKTKPMTLEGLYSNNGDFSLGKYHESYCEVVNRMKTCAETDIMFNGSFDNTWFVIYTNAPAERQLLNHEKTKEYSHLDREILSSGGEFEFIFHFHEEDAINYKANKKLPPDLSDSKKKFLAGLKIYCGQANETELNLFIECEVERALETSKEVTKSVSKDLTSKIADWWRDSSDVLTETSCIWQEIISTRIETMNALVRSNLDSFGVSYNTQVLHSLYLSVANNLAVIVTTLGPNLTRLKVLQTLDKYYTKQFMFLGLESLLLKKREVLCLWQSTWCRVLAIESSSDASELVDVVNEMSGGSPGKLVVLVLSKSSHTPEPDVFKDRFVEEQYKVMHDSFSFSQLDSESRLQIMENKVIFQGIPVSLGSVVKENTEEISGKVLNQLLTPQTVLAIGPRLADLIMYYVPRRLERFDCLNNDIIAKHCHKEYFVVSNILEQEIQEILPYGEKVTKYVAGVTEITSHCLIADQCFSQQDFVNVCSRNSNKSIHWLTFVGGSLAWKQSSDNITLIRQNLDTDNCSTQCSNAVDDRIVLLTAEPGMGKSTLMTDLAKQVQEEDPSLWIIRLNLNDATTLLEEIVDGDYFTDVDNTIKFLSSATLAFEKLAKADMDDFEANLFKSRLKTFENVVIILDGFDEISPDFTNEVISLLKCLLKTKVRKLWVTSRMAMRHTLEQTLSLISYTLQPFNVDDQHSFLIRYWKSITKIDALEEQLTQFASLLLEVTSKSLNDQEKEFTSIPLQTFMLAESFENEMTCFVATGISRLPSRLNLLELYERFIEKKQHVYYKDKAKWDTSKAASRREIQRLKKVFVCNHMNAALILLLSTEQLQQLDSFKFEDAKDFLEDIANEDEKRGIIDGIVANKPHFIHRTFAEYFLALWLSQNLTSVQSFIQNNLFSANYQIIRYFLDCILTKECPFHNAVLSVDEESIKSFLSRDTFNVHVHDKGKRTTLHLAASYPDVELSGNQSVINLLLEHGALVNAVDTVLGWTPLRYADATGLWRHVEKLLCHGGNHDDLVRTRQNVSNADMLYEAAKHGYLKLMGFALDCGVDVNVVVQSLETSTLLHVAADSGNIGSVSFLLASAATLGVRDVAGRTPLHLACYRGHTVIAESLVEAGADVGARDGELSTPLHWAASYGHADILRLLIDRGADMSSHAADGISPLLLAAGNGHLHVVEFLTNNGADFTERDLYGTTALHEAASRGRTNIVDFLVDKGADVNAHDTDGRVPAHWACMGGHLLVVKSLTARGANLPTLHPAAEGGHLPLVTFSLEKGANIDERDEDNATPLLVAASNGHLSVVEFLVVNGANVALRNKDGRTPLHVACEKSRLPVVRFLSNSGADITSRDDHGQTPLHSAAEYGHLEVVQYLVANGAVIDIKDGDSQTPLELATVCQQWETVQWLTATSDVACGLTSENT